jgi:Tfp pilus assembly protein PilN
MSTYDINLFTRKKKSFSDKLLFFLLHYFRYIIVITQIVVIGVFFYRFKVDQRIIDLKESFRSKEQILVLTVPLIDEAQATEQSTKNIEAILKKQEDFQKLYDAVVGTVPEGIIIIEMEFNQGTITIKGQAGDTFSIQRYYRKMRNNKLFSDVTIEELNINPDFNFNFTIEITVLQEQLPAL